MRQFIGIFFTCFVSCFILLFFLAGFIFYNLWILIALISFVLSVFIKIVIDLESKIEVLEKKAGIDDFSEQILNDVVAQGYSGDSLVKEYKSRKANISNALVEMKMVSFQQPNFLESFESIFNLKEETGNEKDRLPYRISNRMITKLKEMSESDRVAFQKLDTEISRLRENPFMGELLKGDLHGYYRHEVTHIGATHEIYYVLEEDNQENVIVIISVGSRGSFYLNLRQYLEK